MLFQILLKPILKKKKLILFLLLHFLNNIFNKSGMSKVYSRLAKIRFFVQPNVFDRSEYDGAIILERADLVSKKFSF